MFKYRHVKLQKRFDLSVSFGITGCNSLRTEQPCFFTRIPMYFDRGSRLKPSRKQSTEDLDIVYRPRAKRQTFMSNAITSWEITITRPNEEMRFRQLNGRSCQTYIILSRSSSA